MIIKIIVALLVFMVVVVVHEFGHFIFAKRAKIKVNEFSVGMGPKIIGKQKGDTLYSIRALPLGGFCAICWTFVQLYIGICYSFLAVCN